MPKAKFKTKGCDTSQPGTSRYEPSPPREKSPMSLDESRPVDKESKMYFSCTLCLHDEILEFTKFTSKYDFFYHMYSARHDYVFRSFESWSNWQDEKKHVKTCYCCQKPYENLAPVILKLELNKMYCYYCPLKFSKRSEYIHHLRQHIKKFMCLLCNAMYDELRSYHRHLLKSHNIKRCEWWPSSEYKPFEVKNKETSKEKKDRFLRIMFESFQEEWLFKNQENFNDETQWDNN